MPALTHLLADEALPLDDPALRHRVAATELA